MSQTIKTPKASHSCIFGTTGVGKSYLGEKLCEEDFVSGKKIIDLQNDKYLEAVSFMGPNTNPRFIQAMKRYKLKTWDRQLKPMAFPTEIYHPIVSGLPENLPDAVKLFSIPVSFFALEEVLRILTSDTLGDTAYVAITQEVEKLKASDALPALPMKILDSINTKILKTTGMGVPMYFSFDSSMAASSANKPFLKVKNVGIFSSQDFEHCMTDRKMCSILKDHRTITAFSTRWIPEQYKKVKLAVTLWLLMKIREEAKNVGGGIVLYIREMRQIMPNPRYSDRSLKVLGEIAEDIVKDCRKAGVEIRGDTQTPWDIPEGVLDQLSLRFIFRHDRRESEIMDMYNGSASLDKERIKNIKKLRNHHFYVSCPGFPTYLNRSNGITLNYKMSGHLEEKENELGVIRRLHPEMPWYGSRQFLEALVANWSQTASKSADGINRRFMMEQEKQAAKSMGITPGMYRVIQYFYRVLSMEPPQTICRFKEICLGAGLSQATTFDSLTMLHNQGFLRHEEQGNYILLPSIMDFVRQNQAKFDLSHQIPVKMVLRRGKRLKGEKDEYDSLNSAFESDNG